MTTAAEERIALETFDGSDPSAYRRWRRREQLMLEALPTTVGKDKSGARLMQHVKGEAELVCEATPVDKLCEEGGDKLLFGLLDDKYGPQPTDLLHTALKEFFYDLSIKAGKTCQHFQARFFHAGQKLAEQDVRK